MIVRVPMIWKKPRCLRCGADFYPIEKGHKYCHNCSRELLCFEPEFIDSLHSFREDFKGDPEEFSLAILEYMPKRFRRVIELHIIEEYSLQRVSEILSLRLSRVRFDYQVGMTVLKTITKIIISGGRKSGKK